MEIENPRVHGSIFFLLKKYVINSFSEEMWIKLNKESDIDESQYELTSNYPIADIVAIINQASKYTGKIGYELQEIFGEYLVPDLFKLYFSYLNPNWKTFDVLENTERVMHGAVRKLNSTANPPILSVTKINANTLIIDYISKRKMSCLAVGIINGIAKYYNEAETIKVVALTDASAEIVQIKVERSV
jgi:hypothetical protein